MDIILYCKIEAHHLQIKACSYIPLVDLKKNVFPSSWKGLKYEHNGVRVKHK